VVCNFEQARADSSGLGVLPCLDYTLHSHHRFHSSLLPILVKAAHWFDINCTHGPSHSELRMDIHILRTPVSRDGYGRHCCARRFSRLTHFLVLESTPPRRRTSLSILALGSIRDLLELRIL